MTYVLHILTHGRRYKEDYASLGEAIAAALALAHEPRERAESITLDGRVLLDREGLEALMDAAP